jgi:hypothetical protein
MVSPVPIPTIHVATVEVPCDAVVLPLTIRHGRASVTEQPDAPDLSMTVIGRVPWNRTDQVTVSVDGEKRFDGFIDSLATDYEGGQFVTKVSAIGWQARAGTILPWMDARPQEDDVARATAFLDAYMEAGGSPWYFRIKGAATVQLVPQDVDGRDSVLALMQDVCDSSGALLWQAKDGALVYGTAGHRTLPHGGAGALLYIDNCDIADGVAWVKSGATLVNQARIAYGPVVDDRTVYEARDDDSILTEGPKQVRIDSLLAAESDAVILGNIIIFRRSRPYWTLPGAVTVLASRLREGDYRRLLGLDVSDLILVRISRDPEAPENLVEWVIEGWTEEWDSGDDGLEHTMLLTLSDRARFGTSGIRTVAELAAGFTVATAGAMTIRHAMFKEFT